MTIQYRSIYRFGNFNVSCFCSPDFHDFDLSVFVVLLFCIFCFLRFPRWTQHFFRLVDYAIECIEPIFVLLSCTKLALFTEFTHKNRKWNTKSAVKTYPRIENELKTKFVFDSSRMETELAVVVSDNLPT